MNTTRKSRRGRRRKNRNVNSVTNPPTNVTIYRGPLGMSQEQLSVVDLMYDYPTTSSSAGTIADYFNDYPVNSPDWANQVATWSEYRVLAMEIRFIPNVSGATQSTYNYAPFYVVWDASGATTPLTSYTQASNYAILRVVPLNIQWRMQHKMDGLEEGTFAPTSSLITDYCFKTYSTGLTVNTTYGRYLLHYKCQFRGRQ